MYEWVKTNIKSHLKGPSGPRPLRRVPGIISKPCHWGITIVQSRWFVGGGSSRKLRDKSRLMEPFHDEYIIINQEFIPLQRDAIVVVDRWACLMTRSLLWLGVPGVPLRDWPDFSSLPPWARTWDPAIEGSMMVTSREHFRPGPYHWSAPNLITAGPGSLP